MQVKRVAFPCKIMVSVAIGKHYRSIVVHVDESESESESGVRGGEG
jgi:hypothetical protein